METWRAAIGGFVQPRPKVKFRPPVLITTAGQLRALSWAILIAGALIMAGDIELNPGPPGSHGRRGNQQARGHGNQGVRTRQATLSFKGTDEDNILQRLEVLEEKVICLERENRWLTNKLDALENQSRRNNLVIYGLQEDTKETWEKSEEKVKKFIKEELNVTCELSVERAHRLGRKKKSIAEEADRAQKEDEKTEKEEGENDTGAEESETAEDNTQDKHVKQSKSRPVIVKFSTWKDREKVITAARETFKGKKSDYSVGEDFSLKIRNIRRNLIPHLIKFRKQLAGTTKQVFLRYDKLIVDQDTYAYDEEAQGITKVIPVAESPQ